MKYVGSISSLSKMYNKELSITRVYAIAVNVKVVRDRQVTLNWTLGPLKMQIPRKRSTIILGTQFFLVMSIAYRQSRNMKSVRHEHIWSNCFTAQLRIAL